MKTRLPLLLGAAFASLVATISFGQATRDFLNTDEVEQIRLVQEPNGRLQLYAEIARKRVGMVEQLLTQNKAGRSLLIHDALEDYVRILDAMDLVADDALKHGADITEGMGKVSDSYTKLLASLKKIEAAEPPDISRYEFVLQNAIDTTEDAIDLAGEDLGNRKRTVMDREKEEKKERESMLSEAEVKEKKEEQKQEEKAQKKRPSLLKKGETLKK